MSPGSSNVHSANLHKDNFFLDSLCEMRNAKLVGSLASDKVGFLGRTQAGQSMGIAFELRQIISHKNFTPE